MSETILGFIWFFSYCLVGGITFKLLYENNKDNYDVAGMSFMGGLFWPATLPFWFGLILTTKSLNYFENKKQNKIKSEKEVRKRVKELEKIEEELEQELEEKYKYNEYRND